MSFIEWVNKNKLETKRRRLNMLNKLLAQYIAEKDGATAIEYGLLAAGISIVLVVAAFAFGDELDATFTDITAAMQGAG